MTVAWCDLCIETGIADYLYKNSKKPPKWMDKNEATYWELGRKLAQSKCIN